MRKVTHNPSRASLLSVKRQILRSEAEHPVSSSGAIIYPSPKNWDPSPRLHTGVNFCYACSLIVMLLEGYV